MRNLTFVSETVGNGSMGTHIYELEPHHFLQYLGDFYPMPMVYPLCCMFSKLSFFIFCTRLSPVRIY